MKVRHHGLVINKAEFLALGINIEGQKELLGMWLADNEDTRLCLNVLTEMKVSRYSGYPVCLRDGPKGFSDAISSIYPQKHIQLCIFIW